MATLLRFSAGALLLAAIGLAATRVATTAQLRAAVATERRSSGGDGAEERRGHDRFNEICSIEELRELDAELVAVVERVRPTVVLLRGERGSGSASTGSAVIISKDGLLATCGHVGRSPGRRVIALLPDGTELKGHTLGQVFEDDVDCGLVQLDAMGRELPFATLGSTSEMSEGDWVIAMGYTHGLRDEVRPSLVRVGRVLGIQERVLLIDASIDAGDSGGPSFNLCGEVVGLNSRCGRESWQNAATPIDQLVERMDALLDPTELSEAAGAESSSASDERDAEGASPLPSEVPTFARGAGAPRTWQFPSTRGQEDKFALEQSELLTAVVAPASETMIQVHSGGRPVALGLIVDTCGLAVTKASQLEARGRITVQTPGKQTVSARVVVRDDDADVALLRFDAGDDLEGPIEQIRAVTWATDAPILPGALLISPRGVDDSPALGFAAIERLESRSDALDGPFLGVQTRETSLEERELAQVKSAVAIVRVVSGTAAERAGLSSGDLIVALGDRPIDSQAQLQRLLGRQRAGDRVRLEVVKPDGPAVVEATLARRGDLRDVRRGNTATPISRRSSGFGMVLAHDAVLRPEEVGGPVVDIEGRVVGMNIARFDRTATHAIDASRMAEICARLVIRARCH
jgi:serine protease Do